jgi:hypothetical protein
VGMYREIKHQKALAAFEKRPELRFCDLPNGIGVVTMEELEKLGLIEVVYPTMSRFSFHFAWRLKK